MRIRTALLLRPAGVLLCLALLACSSPESGGERGVSAQAASAAGEARPSSSDAPASETGPNALSFIVDAESHAVRSAAGGLTRVPAPGVDNVDALTLEVYNEGNTLYAKADLFLASGEPAEGEFALGMLGEEGVRNTPGRGQLVLAIENAQGRRMIVSGDGSLRLSVEKGVLIAHFAFARNGFMVDAPISAEGELRVRAD